MKMGFCEADITPDVPVAMVGFYREDQLSRGVLDSLKAQVSVWEDGESCCLVTLDHIGFTKQDANELRDSIAALLGTTREKVMLCFSHTHAGAHTGIERGYFRVLCGKVCEAAKRAGADMREAAAGWGNAEVEIGVNRREGAADVDKRAGILKVADAENGALRLIVLRLTAHCNALKADNYLHSADWFGAVRKLFEERYHCPVMVVQGSAGNIAPKYYTAGYTPVDGQGGRFVNTPDAFSRMAQEVLDKAGPVLNDIRTQDGLSVSTGSQFLSLFSKVPDREEANRIAEEAKRFAGIDGWDWLEEVERLHSEGIAWQEDPLELQTFRIGDWRLCGTANETMTEFALETAKRLDDPYFYFNGYTNGCSAYFPTPEEYDLGGYEVYWSLLIYFRDHGRVYPYERDAFNQVVNFAIQNTK